MLNILLGQLQENKSKNVFKETNWQKPNSLVSIVIIFILFLKGKNSKGPKY